MVYTCSFVSINSRLIFHVFIEFFFSILENVVDSTYLEKGTKVHRFLDYLIVILDKLLFDGRMEWP